MEGAEDVCIKHRPSVVSVEAFDYAVLCRVARLDIDDVYIAMSIRVFLIYYSTSLAHIALLPAHEQR